MIISASYPPPNGERFAPDAFAHTVGEDVAITVDGHPPMVGKVMSAVVSRDGSNVVLNIDVPTVIIERVGRPSR